MERDIDRGDVVVVRSTWGSGMVMVTDVMPKLFVGVLIHTFPELATDADVVLPQGSVQPYPVVLQFDLYGTFYRTQATKKVGHVPVHDVRFGFDPYGAAKLCSEVLDAYRGLPCWPNDRRWRFKHEQLQEDLMPLTRPFWTAFKW